MAGKITREGDYELFRTPNGHRVLALDGDQFRVINGPQGEKMVGSHDEFEKQKTLERGHFKYLAFDDEDMDDDRLFLQRDKQVQVFLFARGLPTGPDEEVRYKLAEKAAGFDEVETFINSVTSGSGKGWKRSPHEEKYSDIAQLLGTMGFPAEKRTILRLAHAKQASEAVITTLEAIDERNYNSLQDLNEELADREQDRHLGISDLSEEELISTIEAMEPAELHKVRRFEERHEDRDEVLRAIDQRLKN